jgi:UDP-N-acetylglucosamine 2-epimerase (non-hydrolysing)
MLIDIIAGARPNFIKIAPIIAAIQSEQQKGTLIDYRLVHTGQHYDRLMSNNFFEQLRIPAPHLNLNAHGSTHAELTTDIMLRYEKALAAQRPDMVLVVGDVTSTMACALTAKKMNNIPVAHVEAGIRSGDLTMPEEINRIVTDSIADYFFTTTETANHNLMRMSIAQERIFFVGNTMIDTLLKERPRLTQPAIWDECNLTADAYFVMTLHRPSNVDDKHKLQSLLHEIAMASLGLPVVFPVHPRTQKTLVRLDIDYPNLILTQPMGYLEFNYLVQHAKAVITDSGGITEETTVLDIPCMTLRDSSERPETCTIGTNMLLGTNPQNIKPAFEKLFNGEWHTGQIPKFWDGKTAQRIVTLLKNLPVQKQKKQEEAACLTFIMNEIPAQTAV